MYMEAASVPGSVGRYTICTCLVGSSFLLGQVLVMATTSQVVAAKEAQRILRRNRQLRS